MHLVDVEVEKHMESRTSTNSPKFLSHSIEEILKKPSSLTVRPDRTDQKLKTCTQTKTKTDAPKISQCTGVLFLSADMFMFNLLCSLILIHFWSHSTPVRSQAGADHVHSDPAGGAGKSFPGNTLSRRSHQRPARLPNAALRGESTGTRWKHSFTRDGSGFRGTAHHFVKMWVVLHNVKIFVCRHVRKKCMISQIIAYISSLDCLNSSVAW